MGHLICQYQVFMLLFLSWNFHVTLSSVPTSLSPTSAYFCHPDQRLALLQFRNSFSINSSASVFKCDSSYPKTKTWKEGANCCLWDGVSCDRLTGHVVGLDLSCSWLVGAIHSNNSLSQLSHLQSLNLAFNDFTYSPIPPSFGQFASLMHLNLSNSSFAGLVPPEMSHLTKVVSLDLSENQLQFESHIFKAFLLNLTELSNIVLSATNMSSVTPDSFLNMSSSIKFLNLERCELQGKMLEGILRFQNLQELNLGFNKELNASLPQFNRSSPLRILILDQTKTSGTIPSSIGDLKLLSIFSLYNCYVLGSIPDSIGNLTKLTSLVLSRNYLAGQIPSSLSNLESLTEFSVAGNMLNGSIPDVFHSLSKLVNLDLWGNSLSGQIPSSICNLSKLVNLDLSHNSLSGQIPSSICNLSKLVNLDLSVNSLSGQIPHSICNLSKLVNLDLSYNRLTGQIPPSISYISKLDNLDLSRNSLSGQIPSSICNLSKLVNLDLSYNRLSGQIPSSISNLKKLSTFHLSSNLLAGKLPHQISGFPFLMDFDVSNNVVSGDLPPWLFTLPALAFIDLGNNLFTGQIPEFQSKNLEEIYLENNKIQGLVPNSVFELVNVSYVDFSSNNLSGTLNLDRFSNHKYLWQLNLSHNNLLSLEANKQVLSSWPKFETLDLSSCNIISFPQFLRTQDQLRHLSLSKNKIPGPIPAWLWLLANSSLSYLDLSHNSLTSITAFPGCCNSLTYLDLRFNMIQGPIPLLVCSPFHFLISNNKLTGEIPTSICNFRFIETIDLANNSLTGGIPGCLGTLKSLSVLNLKMNNLSGPIPQNFSQNSSLRNINLNGNRLEGPLPRSLLNCKDLEIIDIGDNEINDEFPHWLEFLPSLQVFILRSNRFHGPLGNLSSKTPFPELRIVDLSNNAFTGHLPTKYFENFQAMMNTHDETAGLRYMGDDIYQDSMVVIIKGYWIEVERILTTFTTIDFSNNSFEGQIPEVVGHLKSLRELNLSHNSLSGHIPISLANMTALESLDLSSNKLSGSIPHKLTTLTFLAVLNLSHNLLKGSIPQGSQFNTFTNDSYIGNLGLCGSPLTKKCGTEESPLPLSSAFQNDDDLSWGFDWKIVIMSYGSGLVIGLSLGYMALFSRGEPLWFTKMVEILRNYTIKK